MTNIIWKEITDSTNDDARSLAQNSILNSTWIGATQQKKGRGRLDRSWKSPKGNLYVSWLGHLDCEALEALQLSFVAALAVRDTVQFFLPHLKPQFKWPNDVLIEGKKFCGILLELLKAQGKLWIIVGIGVNLQKAPKETLFPATALGLEIEVRVFLDQLIKDFNFLKQIWQEEGFMPIRSLWLSHAWNLGKEIKVSLPQEEFLGRFQDISNTGALILLVDGREQLINAGDVLLSFGKGYKRH